jgi:uncharacterized membrane protein
MRIETQLDIRAPIERVWDLTVDVEALPSVTPTMTRVERLDDEPLGVGSRARIKQPRQPAAVWTVTRFDRPHVFEWQTKLLSITITGGHRLETVANGCRNTLSVELAGFGSGLAGRLLGSTLRRAIETENQGFRAAAETPGPAGG